MTGDLPPENPEQAMPESPLIVGQSPQISILEYDTWETTNRDLQGAHEADPEFQTWKSLPDGVKKFTERFREPEKYFGGRVRREVLSGDVSLDVEKALADIHESAVPTICMRMVWRGLSGLDKTSELAIADVGDLVPHKTPTSTSTNPAVAVQYSKYEVLIEITVPEGTPIIVCNSCEMEILLPQGFGLRIDRITRNVRVQEKSKGYHTIEKIIHATVIPTQDRAGGLLSRKDPASDTA